MQIVTRPIDARECIAELRQVGAVTIPEIVSKECVHRLLAEIRTRTFVPVPEYLSDVRGSVQQFFTAQSIFPQSSYVRGVAVALDKILGDCFGRYIPCRRTFSQRIRVQQYQPGVPFGIDIHQDFHLFGDFIADVILEGDGDFFVYDDNLGRNARVLAANPGDMILLRAPGFEGRNVRPWHSVGEIRTRRTVMLLFRQYPRDT